MHCDRAREALMDRLDRPLDAPEASPLDEHLQSCRECSALAAELADLATQARVWHELTPPRWNPAAGLGADTVVPGAGWRVAFTAWFPTLASAAALLLALSVFLRNGVEPPPQTTAGTSSAAGMPVEQLLAATRQERQEELAALTTLLKAEMDRRSVETEQSLKYVISHQIQSQRQLESIRSRLDPDAAPASERL